MKYRVWEKILNEVVGGPDMVLIGEVEAADFVEANEIARLQYPVKSILRIDDNDKTAVEFESDKPFSQQDKEEFLQKILDIQNNNMDVV